MLDENVINCIPSDIQQKRISIKYKRTMDKVQFLVEHLNKINFIFFCVDEN